jgi:hypothetical protein
MPATAQRLKVHVITNGCQCDIQKVDSSGNLVGKIMRVSADTTRLALNGFYKGLKITCDSVSKFYPLFYDLPKLVIETDFTCRKEIKKRFYKNFPLNKNNRYLYGSGTIYGLSFVFNQQSDVDYFYYYVVHNFDKADLKHIYSSLSKYKTEIIDENFVSVEGDLIFTYSRDNRVLYYYHINPISRPKITTALKTS